MSTALVPYGELEKMADVFVRSQLFGVKTPDQAMALMLVAQAEGLHPAIAARDYHIIEGRPSLKADAMLARFQTAGGTVSWPDHSDESVTGIFNHPQGGSLTVTWNKARAVKAGLWDKATWKKYPEAMLKARVISDAIRMVLPGINVGTYTPEEVADIVDEAPAPKNVTPAQEAPRPTLREPDPKPAQAVEVPAKAQGVATEPKDVRLLWAPLKIKQLFANFAPVTDASGKIIKEWFTPEEVEANRAAMRACGQDQAKLLALYDAMSKTLDERQAAEKAELDAVFQAPDLAPRSQPRPSRTGDLLRRMK